MDPVALSAVLGFLSTFVFPLLLQSHWSPRTKLYVVMGTCAVAGLEVAYASGQLHMPHNAADVTTVLADVSIVFGVSQAVYAGLKKTGMLDALSRATDVTKPAPAAPVVPPAVPDQPQTERPFGNG